ncbi:hypothetical protein [Idiomarina sp.]|uniref:hypothetical protein n=1 Tax=Idiomarina sp. TaxID=1874361 RepID=UPI0025C2AD6B|nr:hypothetical protein [Idiomarina sp.]
MMTMQNKYPVTAIHHESGNRFPLKPRYIDALINQEQSFLKTYHHDYGFECECHNPPVKMHIKSGDRESGRLFWLADNPNTPEHDPLCEFFKVKLECCRRTGEIWDVPKNIIADVGQKKSKVKPSKTLKTESTLIKKPSLLKRLTHRLLSESLALYNFGNKHSLGYLALKAKESKFAQTHTLENTPITDVLFSDRKGLVFLKKGLQKKRFNAGMLFLTGGEVSSNDRWLCIDSEYYPLTGRFEKHKGSGPFLIVMLWTGKDSPVIRSAYAMPVVHKEVVLPVTANISRKSIVSALKWIQETRTPENKRYLRISLLPQETLPDEFVSEVLNNKRKLIPLKTVSRYLDSTC